MYQRNPEQRNKTNLILVSYFLSRSWKSENVQFAVNMQRVENKKKTRAEYLQKAYGYFKTEVYISITGLNTPPRMFAGDLYCHKNYIGKWNRAISTPNILAKTTSKTKKNIFKKYFPFIKRIIWSDVGIFSTRCQGQDQSKWRCWSEKHWNQELPG